MAGGEDVSAIGHTNSDAVTLNEAATSLASDNQGPPETTASSQSQETAGMLTYEAAGSGNLNNQDELIRRQQEEIAASIGAVQILERILTDKIFGRGLAQLSS